MVFKNDLLLFLLLIFLKLRFKKKKLYPLNKNSILQNKHAKKVNSLHDAITQ